MYLVILNFICELQPENRTRIDGLNFVIQNVNKLNLSLVVNPRVLRISRSSAFPAPMETQETTWEGFRLQVSGNRSSASQPWVATSGMSIRGGAPGIASIAAEATFCSPSAQIPSIHVEGKIKMSNGETLERGATMKRRLTKGRQQHEITGIVPSLSQ